MLKNRKQFRAIGRIIGVLAILLTVNSCYVPIRFDAEIEISREGYYKIIFDGYLVHIPLYDGLRKGKINSEEETKKVASVKTDITRDSSVKEFKYFGKGRFKVHWTREGDILKQKMVTFLRRNAAFITVKYVKTKGTITVEGISISKRNKKLLLEMGINIQGQLRVKTPGRVVSDNATKKGNRKKFYIWNINNINQPGPRLVISLR